MNPIDIHPILVHFPIALLTVYAVIELARFPVFTRRPSWFEAKAVFAILGSLSSFAAYIAGDARNEYLEARGASSQLIETHGAFALATIIVFGLIAVTHATRLLKESPHGAKLPAHVGRRLFAVGDFLLKPAPAVFLALVGLALVTITGGLGGAIVYGPDADPFVHAIYGALFP